jgi:hypothetical protein
MDFLRALGELWQQCRGAPPPGDGKPWTVASLCEAYRANSAARRTALEAQIQERQAELERLVDAFATLTSDLAREVANKRLAVVEQDILALRAQVTRRAAPCKGRCSQCS